MMKKQTLIKHLIKRFPGISGIQDGEDWGAGKNAIHLGDAAEGGEIDGFPACDYYSEDYEERIYVLGVHKKLTAFVEKNGWFVECRDAGTYFAYPA